MNEEKEVNMKRLVIVLTIVAFFAAVSLGIAYYGGFSPTGTGCLCCIQNTCFMAKTEADCMKVGGTVVKTCEECEGKSN